VRIVGRPVGERRLDALRTFDDVAVGQEESVRGETNAEPLPVG